MVSENMIEFEGTETFPAPRDEIWSRLTDLDFMSRCIPGLESVDSVDERRMQCKVRPGLSFLAGRLTVTLEIIDETPPAAATMRIFGKGIGASVTVETSLALTEMATGTLLTWSAQVTDRSGLLKPIGSGLIEAAAQRVITDAWASFREEIAAA